MVFPYFFFLATGAKISSNNREVQASEASKIKIPQ